eukprot:923391-Pelagomonas_calceolata.AAC.1
MPPTGAATNAHQQKSWSIGHSFPRLSPLCHLNVQGSLVAGWLPQVRVTPQGAVSVPFVGCHASHQLGCASLASCAWEPVGRAGQKCGRTVVVPTNSSGPFSFHNCSAEISDGMAAHKCMPTLNEGVLLLHACCAESPDGTAAHKRMSALNTCLFLCTTAVQRAPMAGPPTSTCQH